MSKKFKKSQTGSKKPSKASVNPAPGVKLGGSSSVQTSGQSGATASPKAGSISGEKSGPKSNWNSYGLDQIAQRLVLQARGRNPETLNQGHKMRMAVTYGLERFWGEHLRFAANSEKAREKGKEKEQKHEEDKSKYWKDTWDALVQVMAGAGLKIPNEAVSVTKVKQIQEMSARLWALELEDQRLAMAVLTQLCDCIVWWTQRYKVKELTNDDDA